MSGSRRSFPKRLRRPLENLNMRKPKRKIPEAQDVLNVQSLGISRLTVGTSSRERERKEKFLAFVAPHVEEEDSYSEHSDDGEELKKAYKPCM